ncbi:hypothetical protein RYX36_016640 [Vicia faba]
MLNFSNKSIGSMSNSLISKVIGTFAYLSIRNRADLSTFYTCSFEGYQDTLYTHSMRQFYRKFDIYRTIDVILGNTTIVFQNCNLYPCLPNTRQFNAIFAQGRTNPNQSTETSIHNSTIMVADDLAPNITTVKTSLGSLWKEYSRTIYIQCFMDSLKFSVMTRKEAKTSLTQDLQRTPITTVYCVNFISKNQG